MKNRYTVFSLDASFNYSAKYLLAFVKNMYNNSQNIYKYIFKNTAIYLEGKIYISNPIIVAIIYPRFALINIEKNI